MNRSNLILISTILGATVLSVQNVAAQKTVENPVEWTTATITKQVTPIQVNHFSEIRDQIDIFRNMCVGVSPGSWIDGTMHPDMPIRAVHVNEMRSGLDAIYNATPYPRNNPIMKWEAATAQSVQPGDRIRDKHVTDMRKSVEGLTCCGDGGVNGGEQCDGADLNAASCTDFIIGGFPLTGGTLGCFSGCHFDLSNCEPDVHQHACNALNDPTREEWTCTSCDQYWQAWNGVAWTPLVPPPNTHSTGSGECHFKCKTGFKWQAGSCQPA